MKNFEFEDEYEDEYEKETLLHRIFKGVTTCAVLWTMQTLVLSLRALNMVLPDPQLAVKGFSRIISVAIALNVAAIGLKIADIAMSWKAEGFSIKIVEDEDDEDDEE